MLGIYNLIILSQESEHIKYVLKLKTPNQGVIIKLDN